MSAHYDAAAVAAALHAVGLREGMLVFSHSNIGFFGVPAGERSAANACATILEGFRLVLGPTGTLVVPSFTYSLSSGAVFSVQDSPSNCGIFAEYVRKHPEARRSCDPNISVAALGAEAERLTEKVPVNAYGSNCFWERFKKAGGQICNLNFDAGSTYIHYVERLLGVPYRFDKTFKGSLIDENGLSRPVESTLWVRQLSDPDLEAAFEPFSELAVARGLFVRAPLGRGTVGLISAQATEELLRETLPSQPWLLTKAQRSGRVPVLPSGAA